MKRKSLLLCLCLAASLAAGCTHAQYAKMFLQRDTSPGKTAYLFTPSSEKLVENKTISAARTCRMRDKVEIDVWVMKSAVKGETRGTVLVLHDLGDSKNTYRTLGRMLAEKGFDVVLPDLRAHGRSTGKNVTYGALERMDQQLVMDRLVAEKLVGEPIYVFGKGLGGVVGIQYAALDKRVKGVMAVTPWRDINTVFQKFMNDVALLMSAEDREKVLAEAAKMGKFNPADASAIRDIATLKCPVLLMHGKLDLVTPYTESEALYKAAGGPKELELPPLFQLDLLFRQQAAFLERIEKVVSGKIGGAPTTVPATAPATKPKG